MVSLRLATFAIFASVSVTIVQCDFFEDLGHSIEGAYDNAKKEVGHWGEGIEGAYHNAKEKVDHLLDDTGVTKTVKSGVQKVEEGTSDGIKYIEKTFETTKRKLSKVVKDIKRDLE
ncbi:uncharacterized protein LOC135837702 [Planococcus citri]|uniref:uncharacterized protein LOC135837702 n=1 Tax=Planococcus citri TaxID=170843 RepID=UPI0031F8B564